MLLRGESIASLTKSAFALTVSIYTFLLHQVDYTRQGLFFLVKKFFRYFRLYGIGRTLVKVRGQYHMKKVFDQLPVQHQGSSSRPRKIGLIGCGNYAFANIAYYIAKSAGPSLRGVMDTDVNKAASLFKAYNSFYYTSDPGLIVNDSDVDLVFIASNHASHAEYAIDCIKAGKHVHIEKPHVVNNDQLCRLLSAMSQNPRSKVFLGFNRPRSLLFACLQHHLREQTGPLMINWFIAGHEISDDHWYFNQEEGGRVLGNLCHWTDLCLHLVGLHSAFPCIVQATAPKDSKSDFVFSVLFADHSCATISFSAKGHTFEGVREVLNVHKDNLLANITDFQSLTIETIDKKFRRKLRFRDHGHRANIDNSLFSEAGETAEYIYLTAKFFLAFKESLDASCPVRVSAELPRA